MALQTSLPSRRRVLVAVVACVVLLLVWATASEAVNVTVGPERVSHITLVGCNRHTADQSFWISAVAPTLAEAWKHTPAASPTTRALTDVLLWTGAATYASMSGAGIEASRRPRPVAEVVETYATLSNNTYYASFVTHVVNKPVSNLANPAEVNHSNMASPPRAGVVLGAMDDQDLGQRGADGSYPQAGEVTQAYVDLLHAPPAVRAQTTSHGRPYYISTIPMEPESSLHPFFVNRLCTITLDVRTQRTPANMMRPVMLRAFEYHYAEEKRREARRALREASSSGTTPDSAPGQEDEPPMDDLLGPAQWQWLEDTIAHYTSAHVREHRDDPTSRLMCALTIIVSPLQVFLNDDKPNLGWDSYPFSRSRLMALLQRHEATRFLFVSGHAEVGELGLMRASSEADHPSTGMMRHYEARSPFPSLTGESARLMPDHTHFVVELSSSGLTHAANGIPYVGWLYPYIVGPTIDENSRTRKHPYIPRRLLLDRTTAVERNFATITLQLTERGRNFVRELTAAGAAAGGGTSARPKVDAHLVEQLESLLEVVLEIHSAQPNSETRTRMASSHSATRSDAAKAEMLLNDVRKTLNARDESDIPRLALVQRTLTLSQLASYAGSIAQGRALAPTGRYTASPTRDPIPIFYMYNAPGEYPPIKWYMLYYDCEEFPCVPSSAIMLLKVMGTLTIAAAVLGTAITVMCCGYWHQKKLKRWWRRLRGTKLKKD